ncbi:MAG: PKD domain-containing protein, partial [Elusimicrobiota bacterium]
VSAGPDQTITLPSSANLDGTVTDDGLPSGTLTQTWSRVSGPGTVTFANPTAADTAASFSAAGTYVLRLTATDGAQSVSDDAVIAVRASPPVSGRPVLSWNGVDAATSLREEIWLNALVVPLRAEGSIHYHYALGAAPTAVNETFPGWNGDVQSGSLYHDDPGVAPGSTKPLAGFRVPGEGRYFVSVLGDGYPMDANNPALHGQAVQGDAFRFFIDGTKPFVFGISGRFETGPSFAIRSGIPTPDITPYFSWSVSNPAGPSGLASPIAGYSYSFSTNASAEPPVGAVDPGIPLESPGVHIEAGVEYGQVYYFKVRARDLAGNWSDAASFTYVPRPDSDFPSILRVEDGGLTVPSNGASVGVGRTPDIRVVFSERMDGPALADASRPGFLLVEGFDEAGRRVERDVPLALEYDGSGAAVLRPKTPLEPGRCYELRSTDSLKDEAGNPVLSPFRRHLYTLMDPSVEACAVDAEDPRTRACLPAGAWGDFPAVMAINDPVRAGSMASAAVPSDILRANENARRSRGEYGRLLAVKEFNLYDAALNRVEGRLSAPAVVVMGYADDDNDGVVDGTDPPVRETALRLSWLDESSGVWVPIPGSQVNPDANTVSAPVRRFSVFGLIGEPSLELAGAYAYPVPFRPALGHSEITFTELSSLATIRVYTLSGELVRELQETDGDGVLKWDVTNSRGEPLASDVHFYVIENSRQKKTGKLVVIR